MFREENDNKCVSVHPLHHFHPLLSYGHSPQCLLCVFLLVFAFGFWVFRNKRLLELSWASFSFAL